jgi:hypothetical protein
MNVQMLSGTRMKKPTMTKTVPIPRMPRASCVNAEPREPTWNRPSPNQPKNSCEKQARRDG